MSVKHADLWQRIDRAMQFHKIDCRIFNVGQSKRLHRTNQRLNDQLKDLSLVHQQSNPYEVPFASGSHSANVGDAAIVIVNVRLLRPATTSGARIVLTSERMNDSYLALDDIAALESRHQKLFKATKTGWTRVTEIDADFAH